VSRLVVEELEKEMKLIQEARMSLQAENQKRKQEIESCFSQAEAGDSILEKTQEKESESESSEENLDEFENASL